MSRVCELTGKGRQVGHNVSHANNKTKRTFLPNLHNVTLISDTMGQSYKLRVSTHGLRSVEHNGGLDNWLVKTKDDLLSLKARRLKRDIVKKQASAALWRGTDRSLVVLHPNFNAPLAFPKANRLCVRIIGTEVMQLRGDIGIQVDVQVLFIA